MVSRTAIIDENMKDILKSAQIHVFYITANMRPYYIWRTSVTYEAGQWETAFRILNSIGHESATY